MHDHTGLCPETRVLTHRIGKRSDVVVLEGDRNREKGYSASGVLSGSGRNGVFTDADLAFPLAEVWKIVAAQERKLGMRIGRL